MKPRILFSIYFGIWAMGFAQKNPKESFEYPPFHSIQMPKMVDTVLKNRMRVLLVEGPQYPTLDIRVMIRTGSVWDPQDKVGLASIAGAVIRTGGSQKFPGDTLDKILETLGASIEVEVHQTMTLVTVSLLQEDLDKGLEILADLLKNPLFPEEKIKLAKIEQKSMIARRNDDVREITDREFRKLIYGKTHPYARHSEYAFIDAITRDDLIQFHQKYFQPDGMLVGIWGDFKTSEMKKKVASRFSSWQGTKGEFPHPPEIDYPYAYSVNYIHKPDVNQSNIVLGHIGTTLDNPDYPALVVMNQILSWDRMFKRVRSAEGLAYSVWGHYGAEYDHPGVFSVGCQTKSQSTVKAIRFMLEEIRKMQHEVVTDEELQRAKDQYLNSFVFRLDSKAKIVQRQMTYLYYGYPSNFIEQVKQGVEKVTKEDVLRVAKSYLHPDQIHILVVGKQEDFDEPLSQLGEVRVIDITIPQPQAILPTFIPENETSGKTLLHDMFHALGGMDSLLAIRNAKWNVQITQNTPMGEMAMEGEVWIVYPDKMRMMLSTNWGKVGIVVSSEGAWMEIADQEVIPMPETQVRSIRRSLYQDFVNLAKEFPEVKVQALGQKDWNGKKGEELAIENHGEIFYLLLDTVTKLPLAKRYTEMGEHEPFEAMALLLDYQKIGGILIPMKTAVFSGQEKVSETVIVQGWHNGNIDSSLFKIK